jgi:hypothetical protein
MFEITFLVSEPHAKTVGLSCKKSVNVRKNIFFTSLSYYETKNYILSLKLRS